jgi:hypothetical protein
VSSEVVGLRTWSWQEKTHCLSVRVRNLKNHALVSVGITDYTQNQFLVYVVYDGRYYKWKVIFLYQLSLSVDIKY